MWTKEKKQEYDRLWWESHKEMFKDKRNAYMIERRIEGRTQIDKHKLESGCVDCGLKGTDSSLLVFDHIPGRGKKLFNIGSAAAMPFSTLDEEIDKCEVVCYPCHRERTTIRADSSLWIEAIIDRRFL